MKSCFFHKWPVLFVPLKLSTKGFGSGHALTEALRRTASVVAPLVRRFRACRPSLIPPAEAPEPICHWPDPFVQLSAPHVPEVHEQMERATPNLPWQMRWIRAHVWISPLVSESIPPGPEHWHCGARQAMPRKSWLKSSLPLCQRALDSCTGTPPRRSQSSTLEGVRIPALRRSGLASAHAHALHDAQFTCIQIRASSKLQELALQCVVLSQSKVKPTQPRN